MFMFVLNYTMYKFKMCSIKVFGRNPCKWWTNNIFTRKVTVELIDYKTPLKAGTQPPISSASDEGENKQDKLNKQNRMAWGWFTKLQDNYKYFCINGTVLANDFIVEKFRPNAMKMKRKALKHKASIQTKMARITKMKKRRKKKCMCKQEGIRKFRANVCGICVHFTLFLFISRFELKMQCNFKLCKPPRWSETFKHIQRENEIWNDSLSRWFFQC